MESVKSFLDVKDFDGYMLFMENMIKNIDIQDMSDAPSMLPEELSQLITGINGFTQKTVFELRKADSNDLELYNKELREKCGRCNRLLNFFMAMKNNSPATILELTKLRADIGFYACQVAEVGNTDFVEKSEKDYRSVLYMALQLPPNFTTVSAAVNYSVFLMEIKLQGEVAVEKVKEALNFVNGQYPAGKEALLFVLEKWKKN